MTDEYPKTVLQYQEANGVMRRIQISPRPGSAHWNVVQDYQLPDEDKWERAWAKEARTKPKVPHFNVDNESRPDLSQFEGHETYIG